MEKTARKRSPTCAALVQALICAIIALPVRGAPTARPGAGTPVTERAPLDVRISGIDARGEVSDLNWARQAKWVWAESSPFVRVWFSLPENQKIVSGTPGSALKVTRNPKPSPLPVSGREVLAVDVNSEINSISLSISDNGAPPEEVNLLIQVQVDSPEILTHPSCRAEGIEIQRKQGDAKFLYTAARCHRTGEEALQISLFFSGDSAFESGRIGQLVGQEPHQMRFLAQSSTSNGALGEYSISSQGSQGSSTYELSVNKVEKAPPRVFKFSAGMGFTSASYEQLAGRTTKKTSNMGMTAKLNAGIPLSTGFDLSANIFITAVTLTHSASPSSLGAPRYYGGSIRASQRIAQEWIGAEWRVGLGPYLWGMLVPGSSYGIQTLAGPQVFLLAATPADAQRAGYFYAKFAPISNNLSSITPSNRELALGFGYGLTTQPQARRWTLTGDFSKMDYQVTTPASLTVSLFTLTLGVQTPL